MPRHLLYELLGTDHSSQASSSGLKQHRCLLGGADIGARDVYSINLLEQLGNDAGDLQ